MDHQLSFCVISEIEADIFEIFVNEGAVVDARCAEEELAFWTRIRTEPFSILLNCTNSFSYDFAGAAKIGKSPLQRKIAVVTYSKLQYASGSIAIEINKIEMPDKIVQTFASRNDALAWLRKID